MNLFVNNNYSLFRYMYTVLVQYICIKKISVSDPDLGSYSFPYPCEEGEWISFG